MVRDRDRRKIIWPSYFDIGLTRAEGRRVPKSHCMENPDIAALSKSLEKLDLSFEVEKEKAYPSRWWKKEGRILVDIEMPKTKLLTEIGKKLKE